MSTEEDLTVNDVRNSYTKLEKKSIEVLAEAVTKLNDKGNFSITDRIKMTLAGVIYRRMTGAKKEVATYFIVKVMEDSK